MTGQTVRAPFHEAGQGRRESPEPVTVFVRVKDIRQFFNSLDPSPFIERDLDPNAAAYIVDWVKQSRDGAGVTIDIILPEDAFAEAARLDVGGAVKNFFEAREDDARHELKELFAVGRRYLAFGAVLLLFCLFASQAMRGLAGGPWQEALQESFLILGWVANWKPIETFLYDWQPIVRRRRLYARLASAKVKLTPASGV